MIRPFTIFWKLGQSTFSDFHWFCQEDHSLDRTDGSCPSCHARMSISPFVSYRWYLVELEGGEPVTRIVIVQRYVVIPAGAPMRSCHPCSFRTPSTPCASFCKYYMLTSSRRIRWQEYVSGPGLQYLPFIVGNNSFLWRTNNSGSAYWRQRAGPTAISLTSFWECPKTSLLRFSYFLSPILHTHSPGVAAS